MKAKEMRQMKKEDITAKIFELRKELIKLNAQAATGTQIKDPSLIKKNKRSIARLLTIQGGMKPSE